MKYKKEVIQWAKDKGILDKATPYTQAGKMLEEAKELFEAVELASIGPSPSDKENMDLETGDVMVTLIILSELRGVDLEECLGRAYKKISKRTGQIIDGVFVKDG